MKIENSNLSFFSLSFPNRFNLDKRFEYKCSWKILCIALIFLSIILTVLLAYFASKYIWFWLFFSSQPLSSLLVAIFGVVILSREDEWYFLCRSKHRHRHLSQAAKVSREWVRTMWFWWISKYLEISASNRWGIIQELIIYLELLFLLWDLCSLLALRLNELTLESFSDISARETRRTNSRIYIIHSLNSVDDIMLAQANAFCICSFMLWWIVRWGCTAAHSHNKKRKVLRMNELKEEMEITCWKFFSRFSYPHLVFGLPFIYLNSQQVSITLPILIYVKNAEREERAQNSFVIFNLNNSTPFSSHLQHSSQFNETKYRSIKLYPRPRCEIIANTCQFSKSSSVGWWRIE